jgi:hypothetical protein
VTVIVVHFSKQSKEIIMKLTTGNSILAILVAFCFFSGIDGFVPSLTTRTFSESKHVMAPTRIRSTTSLQALRSHQVAPRIGFRNRVKTTWKKVFQQENKKQTLRRRTMLLSAASALVTLLARPAITLAMGGMGGTKGSVAPMER